MNRVGYIYKITNKVNGKIYIGSTIKGVIRRWCDHVSDAKKFKSGCVFQKAIRKYGRDNFIVETIFCTQNISDLDSIEQTFILKYRSLTSEFGYNMIPTGTGRVYIQETMRKEWANPEARRIRVEAMKQGSQKTPLIAVSRFDLSIREFESVQSAIREGFQCLYQSLNRQCKHAYDYCWFHKEEGKPIESYKTEAMEILGDKFDATNIKPVNAKCVETGNVIKYTNLYEAEKAGFRISAIRRVLRGDRTNYNGFMWELS